MNFNFNTESCQKCPFCFSQDEDMIHDIFNPCCRLKQAQGLEDFTASSDFGTHPTIDINCPALHTESEKHLLYMRDDSKRASNNFWSIVNDNEYFRDSGIMYGIEVIRHQKSIIKELEEMLE